MAINLEQYGIYVPLKEYFQYHPPKTQARIEAHNQVNIGAYDLALSVLSGLENFDPSKANEDLATYEAILNKLVTDIYLKQQINRELNTLVDHIAEKNGRLILFTIQIIRMLANQAITIQELQAQIKTP